MQVEGVHYLPEEAPEIVAPGVAAFWTSSGGWRCDSRTAQRINSATEVFLRRARARSCLNSSGFIKNCVRRVAANSASFMLVLMSMGISANAGPGQLPHP